MKEKHNKIPLSQQNINSIIMEEADKDDAYDCYELEQTMNMIQPYMTNLSDEQRTQIETMKKQMIKKDVSPRLIKEKIMKKLQQFNIYIPTREEILNTLIQEIIKQLHFYQQLKQLRELGYSWDYINYLASEEIKHVFSEDQEYPFNPLYLSFKKEYLKQVLETRPIHHYQ